MGLVWIFHLIGSHPTPVQPIELYTCVLWLMTFTHQHHAQNTGPAMFIIPGSPDLECPSIADVLPMHTYPHVLLMIDMGDMA